MRILLGLFGMACIVLGIVFCFSLVGAIFGVPLLIVGIIIVFTQTRRRIVERTTKQVMKEIKKKEDAEAKSKEKEEKDKK